MVIDIILYRTLGDVLMGTVIVHAIKEKYPQSFIRFHTEPPYNEVLEGNPEIDQIVVIPNNNYMAVYDYISKATPKSDHICRLAMANHYDTLWHHTEETRNQHMIDWYASRTGLDIKIKDYNVRMPITDKQLQSAWMKLALDNPYYIIVHTTSLLETKNWPVQYFNHLLQMIHNKWPGYFIVQIGGESDVPLEAANLIDLRGKTDIHETAALISKAEFYVGIDSGTAYLAGAAGIPTFIIMGSSMGIAQEKDQLGPLVGPIGDNVSFIEPERPNDPHCRPIPCINHCALKSPCINLVEPGMVMRIIRNVNPI